MKRREFMSLLGGVAAVSALFGRTPVVLLRHEQVI